MTERAASVALEALPPATHAPLLALKEGLEAALGANLSALLVYGSAVRGGYVPGESDIDVVIVLQDTSLPHLLAIAEPLQQARFGGRSVALQAGQELVLRGQQWRLDRRAARGHEPTVDARVAGAQHRIAEALARR